MTAADVLVSVTGWFGAVAVLAGYGLVSAGRLSPRGAPFHLLNLAGAALLLINSAFYGAWPSAAVNGFWIAIGIAALVWAARRRTAPGASGRAEG